MEGLRGQPERGLLGTRCYSAHDGVVRSSTWTLARAVAASSLAQWGSETTRAAVGMRVSAVCTQEDLVLFRDRRMRGQLQESGGKVQES